jgi:hypothetical protein
MDADAGNPSLRADIGRANCVYVIPPGKHLFMADEKLIINDRPHEYGMRRAVDVFFRTFASAHNRSRPQSSFQAETATAQSASCGSKRVEDSLSHRTLGKHRTKGCRALDLDWNGGLGATGSRDATAIACKSAKKHKPLKHGLTAPSESRCGFGPIGLPQGCLFAPGSSIVPILIANFRGGP